MLQGWQNVLRFASQYVGGLESLGSSPGARISVVTFSNRRRVIFDFATSSTSPESELQQKILAAPFLNTGTRTGRALRFVATSLVLGDAAVGRRAGVPARVVLVTDGRTNEAPATYQGFVDELKSTGAEVYAVGVGDDVSEPELLAAITGAPSSHLFFVEDPVALALRATAQDILVATACAAEEQQ